MENSSFDRLPAELRVKVYEYALTVDRVSCRPHESSRCWPERSLTTQLALNRVCKQICAECQQLPFALNKLIVGAAPWQERDFSISELYSLADNVAQNIASTPSGLMSTSTTLILELDSNAKMMFSYSSEDCCVPTQTNQKILFDVTPGDEKYGLHLWCEAGDHDPADTGLESRYELKPQIATSGSPGQFIVTASFGYSPTHTTVDCHRDHDRSLCNVAKNGEELLTQMAHLDDHAGKIIVENTYGWSSTSLLRI